MTNIKSNIKYSKWKTQKWKFNHSDFFL